MPDTAPRGERVSIWIYDRRDGDCDTDFPAGTPIFYLARVAEDGSSPGPCQAIWFQEGDLVDALYLPVAHVLDDPEFVREAVAEGRIQRIGTVPELPEGSPNEKLLHNASTL